MNFLLAKTSACIARKENMPVCSPSQAGRPMPARPVDYPCKRLWHTRIVSKCTSTLSLSSMCPKVKFAIATLWPLSKQDHSRESITSAPRDAPIGDLTSDAPDSLANPDGPYCTPTLEPLTRFFDVRSDRSHLFVLNILLSMSSTHMSAPMNQHIQP